MEFQKRDPRPYPGRGTGKPSVASLIIRNESGTLINVLIHIFMNSDWKSLQAYTVYIIYII